MAYKILRFLKLDYLIPALLLGLLNVHCAKSGESFKHLSEPELTAAAEEMAREAIIVDGHIDVPWRLQNKQANVAEATEDGDFDYPRAKKGGLDAPFMSIYVDPKFEKKGAYEQGKKLIGLVQDIVDKNPDRFQLATTPDDVRRNFAAGIISLPMGMENGAPVEGSLEKLREFYDLGIRYITLAHSKWNHISDSSYDDDKHWRGLSPFGKTVVREMNKLGILVDISHVSDDAFWQVMEITAAPAIASHSSCRHFTPSEPIFERNMSDEMIRALAKNGGIIMINFGSTFLTKSAMDAGRTYWNALEHVKDKKKKAAMKAEFKKTFPRATVQDVADHIDHVVKLVGVEHVGFGSDFDGVGDTLPIGLKDVSQYPNLVRELLKRGYSKKEVHKIAGENLLRVWQKNIKIAKNMSAGK